MWNGHHSLCSMYIPWLKSGEFEAAVTPGVPLPAVGLIDLTAMMESSWACMVNARVEANL